MVVGAVLLAGALVVGYQGESLVMAAQEIAAEQKYDLVQVYSGTVEEMVDIQCIYQWGSEENLAFEVDRKLVEKVYVEQGDIVKKGDLLAYLDISEMEKELEELQYKIEMAELELTHEIQLRDFDLDTVEVLYCYTAQSEEDRENRDKERKKVESTYRNRIEDMQDALKINKARLKEMQEYCEQGKLYAGMDGVVEYVKARQEGEYCKKGEKVFSIYDDRSGAFEIINDEGYLEEGKEYTVRCGSGASEQQYFVIAQKREDEMCLVLKESDPALKAATKGTITLTTKKKEDVAVLDKKAVYQVDNRYYVYVVDENGVRRMKDIQVGLQGKDKVEVTGGLNIGDWVIR